MENKKNESDFNTEIVNSTTFVSMIKGLMKEHQLTEKDVKVIKNKVNNELQEQHLQAAQKLGKKKASKTAGIVSNRMK